MKKLFRLKNDIRFKLAVVCLHLVFCCIGKSQSGFIFNETLGADQSASYGIIEHEGYIYSTGTHQDNALDKKGIYIVKLDSLGVIRNHEIYYDENENILAQNLIHDIHVLNNKLYFVASSFAFNDKIIQYDLATEKIDSIYSFELFENSSLRLKSFTVFNNEIISVLNSTSPLDDKIIVQFGLGEISKRIIIDRQGKKESAFKISQFKNDEFIIMNSLFTDSFLDANINLLKIDRDGNILFDYKVDKRSSISFDILEEEDGSYVFPYIELDFGFRSKPKIIKIDETGKELWDVSVGGDIWDSNLNDHWNRVINSNEGDGYVFAGRNTEDIGLDSTLSSGVIGKLSKDGQNIWYKRYNVVDTNIRFHSINDLEKSKSGYVACGELFYDVIIDGIPFVQSYFLRVDNDGNINSDTTATVEIYQDDISTEINIYPNPSGDFFYVDQKNISDVKYQLISIEGKLVKEFEGEFLNQILIVPNIEVPKGSYYLKAYSKEKGSSTWPIIIN